MTGRNGSGTSAIRNGSADHPESRNGWHLVEGVTVIDRELVAGDPCPVMVTARYSDRIGAHGWRELDKLPPPGEPCGLPLTESSTWHLGRVLRCVDPAERDRYYSGTHTIRQCRRCFGILPDRARSDARYCSTACRVAGHRRAVTARRRGADA